MDIVKVNWSGGKDSTCSALLHIKRGDKVKIVSYIPMFTDEIPLILKDHYNFIMNKLRPQREKYKLGFPAIGLYCIQGSNDFTYRSIFGF